MKKLGILVCAIGFVACGSSVSGGDALDAVDGAASEGGDTAMPGPDAVRADAITRDSFTPGGSEYFYVLDQLKIDATDDPAVRHSGFDLDNLYSTLADANGCNHRDFYSLWDNDQHCNNPTNGVCSGPPGCAMVATGCTGGVDNQMPTLANTLQTIGTDVRATLADTVANNRLAILVRVAEVNDLVNDPAVTVQVFRAYPTFATSCTSVLAGRDYSIASSSLRAGATDFRTGALYSRTASIVGGRLIMPLDQTSSFGVPLPFGGATLSLAMHAALLRFDITTSALTRGAFGGYIGGNDLVDAATALSPGSRSLFETATGSLVDIELAGICDTGALPDGGTRRFGGMSVAYEIHGIPAAISTTTPIASAQTAGTCGF